jgi:aryl-alcohol dehydrogenase-like predicted oxidoreductase
MRSVRSRISDFFYQHRVDPAVPIEDVVGTMADLIREGKVRYLGLSECSQTTLRPLAPYTRLPRCKANTRFGSGVLSYKFYQRAASLGVGFVPFSRLGRGFLTEAKRAEDYPADDYRRMEPRLQGENFDRNMSVVDVLRRVAARHHATPGRVALAWLLAQGEDIVPIPGTKRRRYLEDNAGAPELVLTRSDLDEITSAAPNGFASGDRYPEHLLALVDR